VEHGAYRVGITIDQLTVDFIRSGPEAHFAAACVALRVTKRIETATKVMKAVVLARGGCGGKLVGILAKCSELVAHLIRRTSTNLLLVAVQAIRVTIESTAWLHTGLRLVEQCVL